MERFTQRNSNGKAVCRCEAAYSLVHCAEIVGGEAIEYFAELEDKLESGHLVEFPRVRLLAEEGYDKLFSVEWLDKESGDIRSCFCLSEKILKQTLKELQEK